jgi:non-ribosomal peptide synthetase component F
MVQPVRSTEHSPVFQAMFAWESTPRTRLELAGVQVMPLRGEARVAAKFDVALGLREQGGEIVGSLTYAAALYDRPTIERHAEYLRNLLQGLVGDARAVVEQLPMLSVAERDRPTGLSPKAASEPA